MCPASGQSVDFGMLASTSGALRGNEGDTLALLPLGCEYVAVAILGQRAGTRHQPVGTRNGELVGDRAIEDLPSRFDGYLRILVDSKLPLGICRNVGRQLTASALIRNCLPPEAIRCATIPGLWPGT